MAATSPAGCSSTLVRGAPVETSSLSMCGEPPPVPGWLSYHSPYACIERNRRVMGVPVGLS